MANSITLHSKGEDDNYGGGGGGDNSLQEKGMLPKIHVRKKEKMTVPSMMHTNFVIYSVQSAHFTSSSVYVYISLSYSGER